MSRDTITIRENVTLPKTGIRLEEGDVIALASTEEFHTWVDEYKDELLGWIMNIAETPEDAEAMARDFAANLYLELKREMQYATEKEQTLLETFFTELSRYFCRAKSLRK